MLLFAAAAIAASAPQPPLRATAAPTVQATATVRILPGVRLKLATQQNGEGFVARETIVRTAGLSQPARLIEFE